MKENLFLVYVDESSFTRNEGKAYGFAPRGAKLVFKLHKPCYSVGCVAAMSADGLEGFQLRDGMTNKYSFIHFLIGLFTKLKLKLGENFNKVVIYLDNATYHTCQDTLKLLEIVGVSYIFAPAYLSPVNPIEYLFGIIKKRLRRRHIINK